MLALSFNHGIHMRDVFVTAAWALAALGLLVMPAALGRYAADRSGVVSRPAAPG